MTTTGHSLWVEVSSSAPADGATPRPASAVFVDKSAQRRLDYMQHLLLNSVHHELYGPVTTIRGHTQLLYGVLPRNERAIGSLGAILDAAGMMEHILGDMIQILRADPTTRPATAIGPIDVGFLLGRTLRSIPSVAARTAVTVPADFTVYGDPVRLRQVMLVVLDNAEKYAPEGVISISARNDGSCGVISIADRGPGIPDKERPQVLMPYYRSAGSAGRPGSGMGLHIAKVMMSAMHSRIELADAPSGGLEVRLRLPLTRPSEINAEAARGRPGRREGRKGRTAS